MSTSEFRRILGSSLVELGFVSEGASYYKRSDEVICVIGLQKASFANSFFVNIGYVIRSIHPNLDAPRYMDGDIRARFSHSEKGKLVDLFDPKAISSDLELKRIVSDNVNELIEGTASIDGLRALLERRPTMLYQTTVKAKAALGIETP